MKKIKISESNLKEAALIVGFFLFAYGIWLIFKPLSFITAGLVLLWFGYPGKGVKR
jgi:hypothetical protein